MCMNPTRMIRVLVWLLSVWLACSYYSYAYDYCTEENHTSFALYMCTIIVHLWTFCARQSYAYESWAKWSLMRRSFAQDRRAFMHPFRLTCVRIWRRSKIFEKVVLMLHKRRIVIRVGSLCALLLYVSVRVHKRNTVLRELTYAFTNSEHRILTYACQTGRNEISYIIYEW